MIERQGISSGCLGDVLGFQVDLACTPHHLSDFLYRFVGLRFNACLGVKYISYLGFCKGKSAVVILRVFRPREW